MPIREGAWQMKTKADVSYVCEQTTVKASKEAVNIARCGSRLLDLSLQNSVMWDILAIVSHSVGIFRSLECPYSCHHRSSTDRG